MNSYEKTCYVKTARDLLYPPEVIEKIESSDSDLEIERILKTERYKRIDKESNIDGDHILIL